jgi:hypothetical protein
MSFFKTKLGFEPLNVTNIGVTALEISVWLPLKYPKDMDRNLLGSGKDKAIPEEGSSRLRLPDFKIIGIRRSALRTEHLYPTEISLVLISVPPPRVPRKWGYAISKTASYSIKLESSQVWPPAIWNVQVSLDSNTFTYNNVAQCFKRLLLYVRDIATRPRAATLTPDHPPSQ